MRPLIVHQRDDQTIVYCPPASGVAHVPAAPMPRLRPAHARPALHVPPPPVPQQAWPEAPHAPHALPAVASTQARGGVHAVTPPSAGCPTVEQHT
jgi:hypothetical protein